VLRARRNIKAGDEVCIAYLPEDGLLTPTPQRRHELHQTKHFWCDCERCDATEDCTRGVFCPQCKKGTVYSVATDPETNKKEYLSSAWISRKCNACPHIVTQAQAQEMAKQENELKKLVEGEALKKVGATLVFLQDKERSFQAIFSQHFLVDLMWEVLADVYHKLHEIAEQRRVLQCRCTFHKAAYPGLSGTHAWSLEALGDALQKSPASRTSDKKSKTVAVKADKEGAEKCYMQSLDILRLMFGEDHEYVVSVADKLKALQSGTNDAAMSDAAQDAGYPAQEAPAEEAASQRRSRQH